MPCPRSHGVLWASSLSSKKLLDFCELDGGFRLGYRYSN